MATLNELLQDYVNKSYDELLTLARNSVEEIVCRLSKDGDTEIPAKVCYFLTMACIGADGKLSDLEQRFYRDLLGVNTTYQDLSHNALDGNDELRALADQMFDASSLELKAPILSFCLCFLAVDETISRDEIAFINRLLA